MRPPIIAKLAVVVLLLSAMDGKQLYRTAGVARLEQAGVEVCERSVGQPLCGGAIAAPTRLDQPQTRLNSTRASHW